MVPKSPTGNDHLIYLNETNYIQLMECTLVFKCECNDKTYPSKASLNAHKKTKGHKSWEEASELRKLKIELTNRDNTIVGLKNTITSLKELNTILIKRLDIEKSA